eukprot:scpid61325/ scgid6254/ T-complex-associated testis-expressed protein 1
MATVGESPAAGQSSAGAHARSDRKRVRRVIAEDNEWTLSNVPTLRQCILKAIIKNFGTRPLLRELNALDQRFVLHYLPTDLPVEVIVAVIGYGKHEESYWKRCCRQLWPCCDVANHGGNYKRMYLEKHVAHYLETFLPEVREDPARMRRMQQLLSLCAEYVESLDIKQLLPPVKKVSGERTRKKRHARSKVVPLTDGKLGSAPDEEHDNGSASEEEDDLPDDEVKLDHFDFGAALKCLPRLKKLSVVYQVQNVGMNFDWSLFKFTRHDCRVLAKGALRCTQLTELRIAKSLLDDHQARVLAKHIKTHTALQTLDLSFNKIGDPGGKAIVKLMDPNIPLRLTTLILADNKLNEEAANILASMLERNVHMKKLSLRLNSIGDDKMGVVLKSLAVNRGLEEVCLAATGCGEHCTAPLREVLELNKVLKKFDLSCNSFKTDHGKSIVESLASNPIITDLDLRLANFDQETEYQVNQILKKNKIDQGLIPQL